MESTWGTQSNLEAWYRQVRELPGSVLRIGRSRKIQILTKAPDVDNARNETRGQDRFLYRCKNTRDGNGVYFCKTAESTFSKCIASRPSHSSETVVSGFKRLMAVNSRVPYKMSRIVLSTLQNNHVCERIKWWWSVNCNTLSNSVKLAKHIQLSISKSV